MKPLSDRQKRWAQSALVGGPLRPIAKRLFHAALDVEIAIAARQRRRDLTPGLEQITALIKTFERPQACRRLVASLQRFYPQIGIVVVDDSRQPRPVNGTTSLTLPFDSGVSAGRQAGLEHVTTPFVLNLDDDFLLYAGSGVGAALEVLQEFPQLDLVGGRVIDLPLLITHDFRTAGLHPTKARSKVRAGRRFGAVEVLDKVANFFLARTEAVRTVGWDRRLKRLDHADFFTRAKGRIVSGMLDRFRTLHVRDPFDSAYRAHRDEVDDDLALLAEKYAPR